MIGTIITTLFTIITTLFVILAIVTIIGIPAILLEEANGAKLIDEERRHKEALRQEKEALAPDVIEKTFSNIDI